MILVVWVIYMMYLSLGGCTSIPAWGKFWLSLLNCYDWDGNNPVPPELWQVSRFLYCSPIASNILSLKQGSSQLASLPSAPMVDTCSQCVHPNELPVRCKIQVRRERPHSVTARGNAQHEVLMLCDTENFTGTLR